MNVVLWLDLLIAVTLFLAAVIVSIVAIRAVSVWGTLGAVLTVTGSAAMTTSVLAPDLLAQAANQAGLDLATTARILDAFGAHPSGQVAFALFLGGSVLGPVLLRCGPVERPSRAGLGGDRSDRLGPAPRRLRRSHPRIRSGGHRVTAHRHRLHPRRPDDHLHRAGRDSRPAEASTGRIGQQACAR
jgi:hypothetical protein